MSAETKLVARLKATAGVTALIGTGDAARVRPQRLRQGEGLPAITYLVASDSLENHSTGATTTREKRIQVNCLAASYDGAIALAAAVEAALSGWNDADGDIWHLDVQIDDVEETIAGQDEPECYRRIQDYIVWTT